MQLHLNAWESGERAKRGAPTVQAALNGPLPRGREAGRPGGREAVFLKCLPWVCSSLGYFND